MTAPKPFREYRPLLITTDAQYKANRLSHDMREKLVAHAPGPQPIVVGCRTTKALQCSRLIKYNNQERTNRPLSTSLTEHGREVVCVILGQYADALVIASQFLQEQASPPIVAKIDREMALAKIMATEKA